MIRCPRLPDCSRREAIAGFLNPCAEDVKVQAVVVDLLPVIRKFTVVLFLGCFNQSLAFE
jgi:hypothetical protein